MRAHAEVFISATTRELRSYRGETKNALLTLKIFPIEQYRPPDARRLNSNIGIKSEIEIEKSTRRPFQRASDSYPSTSPRGCHPIESDPVERFSPTRF
jgi:hypothetical protein